MKYLLLKQKNKLRKKSNFLNKKALKDILMLLLDFIVSLRLSIGKVVLEILFFSLLDNLRKLLISIRILNML